jgi:hypothetical protein
VHSGDLDSMQLSFVLTHPTSLLEGGCSFRKNVEAD